MKKLTLLCQVFYPDSTSTSQLFQTLLLDLQSAGWEITVYCGFPTLHTTTRIPRLESWNNITIQRCGIRLSLKKNLVLRGLSYFAFLLDAFARLLISPKHCVWLGVTNPPLNAHILALAAGLRQHTFSYYFLDLHPEGLFAINKLSHQSLVGRFWILLNRLCYRRIENIFVLGRDMLPILNKNYGIDKSKITYCPHWSVVANTDILPISKSPYIAKWNLEDKFVIQYSGNMGLWHDINCLVNAAYSLQHDRDIQFVFIGNGIRKGGAMNLAKTIGVTNIVWKDFLPIDELRHSLAACHLSIISLRKNLEGIAVPCKLYGILSSGRGILAQVPSASEIALTVTESNCGLVIEPSNDSAMSTAISQLKQKPELVKEMGSNAYSVYQNQYTVDTASRLIDSCLDS